ncbi:hypothetical protein BDY24DRAFT_30067 [Mrakia frigida]|uniref:uncharacterized protein n=1 Tax=Mrakia frigida TaxID=29902 RepID=UPI003FCC205C
MGVVRLGNQGSLLESWSSEQSESLRLRCPFWILRTSNLSSSLTDRHLLLLDLTTSDSGPEGKDAPSVERGGLAGVLSLVGWAALRGVMSWRVAWSSLGLGVFFLGRGSVRKDTGHLVSSRFFPTSLPHLSALEPSRSERSLSDLTLTRFVLFFLLVQAPSTLSS